MNVSIHFLDLLKKDTICVSKNIISFDPISLIDRVNVLLCAQNRNILTSVDWCGREQTKKYHPPLMAMNTASETEKIIN